jgi:hypothetical protein
LNAFDAASGQSNDTEFLDPGPAGRETRADDKRLTAAERERDERRRQDAKPNGHVDGQQPLPYQRGENYRQLGNRQMVVKGLCGAGELSVWSGPPKSGKSFLVTDAALAVADEHSYWFGHRIKRCGLVVYAVMEGTGGFPTRLAAWAKANARPVPETFVWVPVRLRFLSDASPDAANDDVQRLRALIGHLEAETQLPCVLVAIDTAARAMTGGDENSAQDMGRFLDACASLQNLPSRPHVAVIHHDNAAGTKARGSTALPAGADALVRIERTDEGRAWSVEFAKDDDDDRRFGFRLDLIPLGEDEDGDRITSCVVQQTEAPAKANAKREPHMGDVQHILMRELRKLAARHPEGVDRSALRSAFICTLNADRQRDGQDALTADQAATKFRQVVLSLRRRLPALFVEDGDLFSLPGGSRGDA